LKIVIRQGSSNGRAGILRVRATSSAGLIQAGTFAVLTTIPFAVLFQLGAVVAVGVLLDTFIVRGLLIPSVVSLGRANWWPSSVSGETARPNAATAV
jgi:uncharacterized membrane protein YdfJ with MMPL/SSD domain